MTKIFGLGLSKTGTSSLAAALKILGFRTVHNPTDDATIQDLLLGRLNSRVLNDHDAFTDVLFIRYFRVLGRLYPHSKFILTIRDMQSWLRSCAVHWEHRGAVLGDLLNEDLIDLSVYGTTTFNEGIFSDVYEHHVDAVRKHFAAMPERLLTINIVDGEGWGELCRFLRVAVPDKPFPHVRPLPWTRSR